MSDLASTIENAFDAATSAALNHPFFEKDHADCGRAWVVLTQRKGRKAIITEIARQHPDVRTAPHHAGGVSIHILRGGPMARKQSRAIFEAGCDAFISVLAKAGIAAHLYTYAD